MSADRLGRALFWLGIGGLVWLAMQAFVPLHVSA